jgi:hypothetical protein
MIFLFTKSGKIGSKLIRWGLNARTSHFAIGFDCTEDGFGVVLHSHYSGVHLSWYDDFARKNEIVYKLKPKKPFSLQEEEELYQSLLKNYYGKGYDIEALAYFSYVGLLHRLFKKPLPDTNPFDSSDKYLCVEIYKGLSKIRPDVFPMPEKSLAIMHPDQVYFLMKQSTLLIEEDAREKLPKESSEFPI